MSKKKRLIPTAAELLLAVLAGLWLLDSLVVLVNNARLKRAVREVREDTVQLNELVPFEWDAVYTFGPYETKEEITRRIGFRDRSIKENWINEGMVHLLFVKGQRVQASVLGYPENLGYSIDFTIREGWKITRTENAAFAVTRKDGITALTLMQ